jgi:hypothetical protein
MASRIPVPDDAQRVRLVLSPAELHAVEDCAHLLRLSVASFVRVALVEASRHPERADLWRAVAAELSGGGAAEPESSPAGPKKRGRPPKKNE